MKQNLVELRTAIERHLDESGITLFYGHARHFKSAPVVFWDCQEHPDYREFIQAAQAVGVNLIVLHSQEFDVEQIDTAMDQLVACDLPREEARELERRLKEMRAFDGFVCEIELSFSHQGSVFVFDLRTDWYRALTEVLAEIDVLTGMDEGEDDSLGGYFSKN